MPIIKCPKCGEEYDTVLSIHVCKVEEKEKLVKEEEKWKHKSTIARFFIFSPGTPLPLKILAFFFALGAAIGLILLFLGIALFLLGERVEVMGVSTLTIIYGLILFLFGVIFFYGIGHMRRWAFYLYGGTLFIGFAITFLTKGFGPAISSSIIPAIIFLILWTYREKFFINKNQINI